jgi:hypothetical protein
LHVGMFICKCVRHFDNPFSCNTTHPLGKTVYNQDLEVQQCELIPLACN